MWAILAICCAVAQATMDACAKKAMEANISRQWLLTARYALALPLLAPLLWLGDWPQSTRFWLIHLPWIPMEVTAILLTLRALRVSPMSLTLPFLSFTPMFLVLTEGLILGVWVQPQGLIGIALIVAGSYALHLGPQWRRDPFYPLRAIAREPGTRLMLIVAFLYSLTSLCGAELVRHSSPWYFSAHYAAILAVIFGAFSWRQGDRPAGRRWHWAVIAGGASLAAMALTNMWAFETSSHVAYVIAMKRLSGAVGVIYGRVWFDEQAWGTRLAGSLIMAAGSLLILVSR